jgi:hypothetical protein
MAKLSHISVGQDWLKTPEYRAFLSHWAGLRSSFVPNESDVTPNLVPNREKNGRKRRPPTAMVVMTTMPQHPPLSRPRRLLPYWRLVAVLGLTAAALVPFWMVQNHDAQHPSTTSTFRSSPLEKNLRPPPNKPRGRKRSPNERIQQNESRCYW